MSTEMLNYAQGIQEMNRVVQFISILTVLNQVNSISIIRQSII